MTNPDPVRHDRPPRTVLRGQDSEVAGESTSYCWKFSDTQGLCACGRGWADPEDALESRADETLTFDFGREDAPKTGELSIDDRYDGDFDSTMPFDRTHPTMAVPVRPGTTWVRLFTTWPEGDVTQVFKIVVPGPLSEQTPGSILGRIDGDPKQSQVTLVDADGHETVGTIDDEGRYRFNNLLAGTYTVEATVTNYPTYTYSPDGTPTSGSSSRWSERRDVALRAGEIHREDFAAAS